MRVLIETMAAITNCKSLDALQQTWTRSRNLGPKDLRVLRVHAEAQAKRIVSRLQAEAAA